MHSSAMLSVSYLILMLLVGCRHFCNAVAPLSLHNVVEVAVGGDVTVTLLGHDTDMGQKVRDTSRIAMKLLWMHAHAWAAGKHLHAAFARSHCNSNTHYIYVYTCVDLVCHGSISSSFFDPALRRDREGLDDAPCAIFFIMFSTFI